MPKIMWTVDGHEVVGDDVMETLDDDKNIKQSQLRINTDDGVTAVSINCQAENSEGVLSKSLHVNMEYLPSSIQIHSPASVLETEQAHVSCVVRKSFPVPVITWKLSTFTDNEMVETLEHVADLSDALDEDDTWTLSEEFIIDREDVSHAAVSCIASVQDLGLVSSNTMEIVVERIVTTEAPVEDVIEQDEYETETENDLFHNFVLNPDHFEGENSTEEYSDDYDIDIYDLKQLNTSYDSTSNEYSNADEIHATEHYQDVDKSTDENFTNEITNIER